jgi:hypothetical protein
MKEGYFRYGWITSESDSTLFIRSRAGAIHSCHKEEILGFQELGASFKDRIDASIDLGLQLAKANNLRQYTLNSKLGYIARKWQSAATFSALYSFQDEIDPIERLELDVLYRYITRRNWILDPTINMLSNSEQKLRIRSNFRLGAGKFLLRTNHGYLGLGSGAALNVERFTNETPDRESWEWYLGTEINLYDLEDLSLLTKSTVYAGLTEKGRWRADFSFTMKYDLPLDFYIRLELTANFDNQPAEGASEWDYLTQLSFGWSW